MKVLYKLLIYFKLILLLYNLNYFLCLTLSPTNVKILANIIETTAAIKTEIFDTLSSISLPLNAISDTNKDIVNPIPASIETSNTSYQDASVGFLVMPIKLPKYPKIIIPNGFPITNPNIRNTRCTCKPSCVASVE